MSEPVMPQAQVEAGAQPPGPAPMEAVCGQWCSLRQRLVARGLMAEGDSLSLRDPVTRRLWWGTGAQAQPRAMPLVAAPGEGDGADRSPASVAAHRLVYAVREDVCAALLGGGPFGRQLSAFGGRMPSVFDEQIRQLGRMGRASDDARGLRQALAHGGNVALHLDQVLVLGMTPARLALNAELFEKCAKAYVPVVAGGARTRALPWLVRYIANGRLMKEEAKARDQVLQGLWPVETRGY